MVKRIRFVAFIGGLAVMLGLVGTQFSGSSSSMAGPEPASMQIPCIDPPANMVAWYPGDGNADDITTYANNGTAQNGAAYAAGKVGQAFSLDGVDDHVTAPDAAQINFGTGDFSIDAWVATSATGDVHTIVDKRIMVGDTAPTYYGYSFFILRGQLGVQLADGGYTNYISATALADGMPHHVAVTVVRNDQTGGTLYADGMPVLTFDPTLHPGNLDNTSDLYIGQNTASVGGGSNWDGGIDEVELFNRALTQTEIEDIFNADTSGKCKCTLTCPADITVSNNPGRCGAGVRFQPTVTGPCTATCNPPPGFFDVGTTTVTCDTTDPSGNSYSCSFTVTVNDTERPTIVCPPDISVPAGPSCSAVVTYAPMANDNCPGVTTSCTPPSGSTFALGTTVVSCTATDAAGLTFSCRFRVTVTNAPPSSNAGPDQLVNENTGVTLTGMGSDPDPGQTAVLAYQWMQTGGPPVVINNANMATATFTAPEVPDAACVPLTFDLTVTDPCGATATDTVVITVVDTFEMADDRNGNCLVITRTCVTGTSAMFCWKTADGTVYTGPCDISKSSNTLNVSDTTGDNLLIQGLAEVLPGRDRGSARLTIIVGGRPQTLTIFDSRVSDSMCICP